MKNVVYVAAPVDAVIEVDFEAEDYEELNPFNLTVNGKAESDLISFDWEGALKRLRELVKQSEERGNSARVLELKRYVVHKVTVRAESKVVMGFVEI